MDMNQKIQLIIQFLRKKTDHITGQLDENQ